MKKWNAAYLYPHTIVFLAAFLVRLVYNVTVARGYYPQHDSLTYQTIAYNLLNEHCYCLLPHQPTVDRAPLWPAIIAVIYGTLGPHDFFVRGFLCILGSGTCVLIYCFARDLFGQRVGMIAGLAATIYPFLYIYDGWLYTESLYTFLLLAFSYVLYHCQRKPQTRLMLLSGVLLGALALTRPNGLFLLGLFMVWAIASGSSKTLSWSVIKKWVGIVVLVILLIVAPWTVRNYVQTREFVPVAIGDGKVFLGAYNDMILQIPYFLGIWIIPRISVPEVDKQFPTDCAGECEVQRDRMYRHYAWQWIQSHRGQMPYLLLLHAENTWQTTTQEADLAINRFQERSSAQLVVWMMKAMTPLIFGLAASGLAATWRRWREWLFIYLLFVLMILQNIVYYGIPRFRAPLEPMLLLFGAG